MRARNLAPQYARRAVRPDGMCYRVVGKSRRRGIFATAGPRLAAGVLLVAAVVGAYMMVSR